MEKILIIEDYDELALAFKEALVQYDIKIAANLQDARQALESEVFDLIIMDITLPDGSGLQFYAEIGANPKIKKTSVLFITGRNDIGDKLIAFSLGADDFIVKPIDLRELRARIDSKLKNKSLKVMHNPVLRKGILTINKDSQQAYLNIENKETLLDFTPFALRILTFFVEHENIVFSRDLLLERLWGGATHVFNRTIDAHICKIRKKLANSGYSIQSIDGEGYVFRKSSKYEDKNNTTDDQSNRVA
ncbi:MAG: response regulator transcription factor [Oligoflexia bacterium]|nr:response regulator transcription factor [Oligoflexia bacterium]